MGIRPVGGAAGCLVMLCAPGVVACIGRELGVAPLSLS